MNIRLGGKGGREDLGGIVEEERIRPKYIVGKFLNKNQKKVLWTVSLANF